MENKYERERIKGTTQLPLDKGLAFDVPYSSFNIYMLSDLHCGAMECNYKLLDDVFTMIEEDRNAVVVVGGDTIEAIPRGYKINEEGQHCSIDAQIARTINEFKRIQKKVKIMFKGNHNTKARGESIDSDFVIANALGVPYKTVPSVIIVRTPKGNIRLAGGHGRSGASNSDLELEKVMKIFPGCDIYFLGHNHALYAKQYGALVYDEYGNEHWAPAWVCRTGNFLNYAEYARYSFYAPQRSGCIKFKVKNGKVVAGYAITEADFK